VKECLVAVLKFDAEMELVEIPGDLFKLPDDAQAVINVTHVIVGHFQYEKRCLQGCRHSLC